MADVQTYQNRNEFELRKRKRGPFFTALKLEPRDQDQDQEDYHGEGRWQNHRVSIDQRNPSPSHTNSESVDAFRTLIAKNTGLGNICLSFPPSSSSSSSSTPTPDSSNTTTTLFYITNGSLRRNTPSVTLSHATKNGPVLGTLKLGFSRDNTFGIGDPHKDTEIAWENLRRTSGWTHGTYEFAYGGGREYGREYGSGLGEGDGNEDRRRVYVWQRTRQGVFSDQPDMELREKLVSGEGVGEVLAVYKGNQGLMWKSRGQFSILKGLNRGKPGWSGKEGGEWSEFELVILLTGLGIIESSRRRARGRRGGGASGGGG